jgi:hypothetical protein
MPYLHCPHCHRTAWLRAATTEATTCRGCGGPLDDLARDVQILTLAVRDRFARDAARTGGMRRFVRDGESRR